MVRMPPGKPRLLIAMVILGVILVMVLYNAVSSFDGQDLHKSSAMLGVQGPLHNVQKRRSSAQRSLATAGEADHVDTGEGLVLADKVFAPDMHLEHQEGPNQGGQLSSERQRSPLESDPQMKHLGKDAPQGNVGVTGNLQLPPPSVVKNQGPDMPLDGKEANILIQGPPGERRAVSGNDGRAGLDQNLAKVGVDKINMNQRVGEHIEAPVGPAPYQAAVDSPVQVKEGQPVTKYMHKLVHLDLKGAPPKVTYFEQVFPLYKKWGATGLLIEYEDMFPYSGNLEVLSAFNAYRPEEIKTILQLAQDHGLIVIPLIQTFGHMEYVLKHAQFRHLREIDRSPQIIIPLKTESLDVIKEMVDQIMTMHPMVSHLHIGSDEVYYLGVSDEAKKIMAELNIDRSGLFIRHVEAVASYIRKNYPHVQPIMWDDMMRKMDFALLQASSLVQLVEPMVWVYTPKVTLRVDRNVWRKYAQVFNNIWVASAFKGATGADQIVTDISYHMTNHQSWLRLLGSLVESFSNVHVQGIVLTGWQRYDHFAVLCELLPVGFPSLAVNLQVLVNGKFDEQVHQSASQLLQCQENVELELQDRKTHTSCSFPGSAIYDAAFRLRHVKAVAYGQLMRNPSMNSWLNDYFVQKNFVNPDKLGVLFRKYQPLMEAFNSLEETFHDELLKVYGSDTIQEFVEVHVTAHKKKLESFYDKAAKLVSARVWPRRPLS